MYTNFNAMESEYRRQMVDGDANPSKCKLCGKICGAKFMSHYEKEHPGAYLAIQNREIG